MKIKRIGMLALTACAILMAGGCSRRKNETVLDAEKDKTIVNEIPKTSPADGVTAAPGPTETPEPELPYIKGNLKRVSVHDPSIIADKDEKGNKLYYIFGTHIAGARSYDLANWSNFTNGYRTKNNTLYGDLSANLSEPFSWAGEDDSDCRGGFAVWAPHVIYNPHYVNEDGSTGAYMDYFCTSSTYCRSVIGFAVSDRIDGDYACKGTIVYSGFTRKSIKDKNSDKDKIWTNTNIDELMEAGKISEEWNSDWGLGTGYNTDYAPNAIDPAILFDKDGKMWMAYGSWSGGIYMLELNPKTGEALYPGENGVTEDGRIIDKYFGVRIAGGHTKSGEGPFIVYDEATDYYYLYTTYNYLDSVSGYNMRLFRSKEPTGPYLDACGNNAVFGSKSVNMYNIGIKVMGNYSFSCMKTGYRSPGHCSAFIDSDGQRYLIYHTRFETGGEMFQTRVHQQFMNEKGWPVTAVFENRGDVISETGYAEEKIVGKYEFIDHGLNSDGANCKKPSVIWLNKDGTVSGDASGTWNQKEGTCFATLVIEGTEYSGVFFRQHDEASKSALVMTFTAIGDDNKTLWGVRTAGDEQ